MQRTFSANFDVERIVQEDSDGCAIASVAMIVNYLKGTDLTYDRVKKDNGGSVTVNFEDLLEKTYKLNYTRYNGSFSSLRRTLFEILVDEEIPTIVQVTNQSGGSHFVVVNHLDTVTLPVYVDDDGNEVPDVGSITSSNFGIVDPGRSGGPYTLADVISRYDGDLTSIREAY